MAGLQIIKSVVFVLRNSGGPDGIPRSLELEVGLFKAKTKQRT